MKNQSSKYFLILLTIATTIGCTTKEFTEPVIPIDYSERHRFFPLVDSTYWIYNTIQYNENNNVVLDYDEDAFYFADSGLIQFYYNGDKSWTHQWKNSGSKMIANGSFVLLDYDLLGCNEISNNIFMRDFTDYSALTEQFCKFEYPTNLLGIDSLQCIKTITKNTYSSGMQEFTYLYAKDVGMFKKEFIWYDSLGVKKNHVITTLKEYGKL